MLDHDRYVRLDNAGKIRAPGNRLRHLQIVKSDVFCSSGWNGDLVWADGVFVREKHGNPNVGVRITGIEDAGRLVALHFRLGAMAPFRNITFGDSPPVLPNWLH